MMIGKTGVFSSKNVRRLLEIIKEMDRMREIHPTQYNYASAIEDNSKTS